MDFRLESALQKENIKQIKSYRKMIDQCKNGTLKNEYTFISDISSFFQIFNLIEKKEYKKALSNLQNLDSEPRDEFPSRIWDLLHKINGEEY
jgi:hypothetical protein